MSDFISRKELLRHIADLQYALFAEVGFEKEYEIMNDIFECVENMPTAYDVDKVVHGFNTYNHDDMFECSICGFSDYDTLTADCEKYNFCPNCGAKMDGKKEDPCSD